MAKSKSNGRNYVSKGERQSTNQKTLNAMRSLRLSPAGEFVEKINAWRAGKRVMLTVPNPNSLETNKPFVRVEAREVWGSPFHKDK